MSLFRKSKEAELVNKVLEGNMKLVQNSYAAMKINIHLIKRSEAEVLACTIDHILYTGKSCFPDNLFTSNKEIESCACLYACLPPNDHILALSMFASISKFPEQAKLCHDITDCYILLTRNIMKLTKEQNWKKLNSIFDKLNPNYPVTSPFPFEQ